MLRKLFLLIAFLFLGLIILGVASWFYRDAEPVRGWLVTLKPWLPAELQPTTIAPPMSASGGASSRTPGAAAAQAGGLRKCRQGGKILYTSEACPPGSVEQGISGGTVTSMPGQQAPAQSQGGNSTVGDAASNAAAKAGLGPQTLRDLAGESHGREINDRRIDNTVNK